MNASDAYKAGRLTEAIEAATQEVKAKPADQNRRLFLFELLAFAGDLERARRHIEAIKYEDIELETATQTYRRLIDSEERRRRLFREGVSPQFLAEPTEETRLRLAALNHLREQRPKEAMELLRQAEDAADPIRGNLNGKAVQSIRDCDDLFGTVLEAMAHGEYYWVPLQQVESLAMKAPRFPRDLIWLPARLEMKDVAGDVFLPVLYPKTYAHEDSAVRLGRKTDWLSSADGPVRGVGTRIFLVDDDAINLLDWREYRAEGAAG